MRSGWGCALVCRCWRRMHSAPRSRPHAPETPMLPSSLEPRHRTPGVRLYSDHCTCSVITIYICDGYGSSSIWIMK